MYTLIKKVQKSFEEIHQIDDEEMFRNQYHSRKYISHVTKRSQVQKRSKYSNKNFLKLLESTFTDPAMIVYLNNEKSYAQNPNENLAREFFELFSLGEGNYTENDIKNLARYLSGNSINFVTEQFKLYPNKQSSNLYSAFGKNYKNNKEFFENLKNHPAFGEFIALKFYKEYVDLKKPSSEDLAYLVSYFKKHNFAWGNRFKWKINFKIDSKEERKI